MMISSSPLKTLSFDRFKMDSGDKNDRNDCVIRPNSHCEGFGSYDNLTGANRWFKNRRPKVSNLKYSAVKLATQLSKSRQFFITETDETSQFPSVEPTNDRMVLEIWLLLILAKLEGID